jgi:hypothetical protein
MSHDVHVEKGVADAAAIGTERTGVEVLEFGTGAEMVWIESEKSVANTSRAGRRGGT